jgi:hypothetical protein
MRLFGCVTMITLPVLVCILHTAGCRHRGEKPAVTCNMASYFAADLRQAEHGPSHSQVMSSWQPGRAACIATATACLHCDSNCSDRNQPHQIRTYQDQIDTTAGVVSQPCPCSTAGGSETKCNTQQQLPQINLPSVNLRISLRHGCCTWLVQLLLGLLA